VPLPVWAADAALDAVANVINSQARRKRVMRFVLENQLVLIGERKRRNVEGTPARNKVKATSSITEPTRTPTPSACRKLETYPNSNEQIPPMLASGMLSVAINNAMWIFTSISSLMHRPELAR